MQLIIARISRFNTTADFALRQWTRIRRPFCRDSVLNESWGSGCVPLEQDYHTTLTLIFPITNCMIGTGPHMKCHSQKFCIVHWLYLDNVVFWKGYCSLNFTYIISLSLKLVTHLLFHFVHFFLQYWSKWACAERASAASVTTVVVVSWSHQQHHSIYFPSTGHTATKERCRVGYWICESLLANHHFISFVHSLVNPHVRVSVENSIEDLGKCRYVTMWVCRLLCTSWILK